MWCVAHIVKICGALADNLPAARAKCTQLQHTLYQEMAVVDNQIAEIADYLVNVYHMREKQPRMQADVWIVF